MKKKVSRALKASIQITISRLTHASNTVKNLGNETAQKLENVKQVSTKKFGKIEAKDHILQCTSGDRN